MKIILTLILALCLCSFTANAYGVFVHVSHVSHVETPAEHAASVHAEEVHEAAIAQEKVDDANNLLPFKTQNIIYIHQQYPYNCYRYTYSTNSITKQITATSIGMNLDGEQAQEHSFLKWTLIVGAILFVLLMLLGMSPASTEYSGYKHNTDSD